MNIYIYRISLYMVGMTDWPMHRIWHLLVVRIRKVLKDTCYRGVRCSVSIFQIYIMLVFLTREYSCFEEEHKFTENYNKLFPYILLKNTQHRKFTDYFKTACEGYKNIALIDVGWMGNIQSVFMGSLGAQWAEKQIHRFYLALCWRQ